MFTSLRLERFKNFKDAELKLGPFTVLIGANASGKSNIRDAFRFLHGIARGYSLADIIGEKYGEGGERVWTGIRGGTPEITFAGDASFALTSQSCHSQWCKSDAPEFPTLGESIPVIAIKVGARKRQMPSSRIASSNLDVGEHATTFFHSEPKDQYIQNIILYPDDSRSHTLDLDATALRGLLRSSAVDQ